MTVIETTSPPYSTSDLIEQLRTRAAAAEAEAADLRAQLASKEDHIEDAMSQIERVDLALVDNLLPDAVEDLIKRGEGIREERDILRAQLALVTDLVPDAELLKRLALHVANDYIMADDEPPAIMSADIDAARALAARIRDWRGDGDGIDAT